jgi:hypothetical protein
VWKVELQLLALSSNTSIITPLLTTTFQIAYTTEALHKMAGRTKVGRIYGLKSGINLVINMGMKIPN